METVKLTALTELLSRMTKHEKQQQQPVGHRKPQPSYPCFSGKLSRGRRINQPMSAEHSAR